MFNRITRVLSLNTGKFARSVLPIGALYFAYKCFTDLDGNIVCRGDASVDSQLLKAANERCWKEGNLYTNISLGNNKQEQFYHNYYVYTYAVFCFALVCITTPFYLWNFFIERGLINKLIADVWNSPFVSADNPDEKTMLVIKYLSTTWGKNYHVWLLYKYWGLKIFNMFIPAFLILVLDTLVFNGYYSSYCISVAMNLLHALPLSSTKNSNPLFAYSANCNFIDIGPSGTGQTRAFVCELNGNVGNSIMFVGLFYFLMLYFLVASITLIYQFNCFLFCGRSNLIKYAEFSTHANDIIKSATKGNLFILQLLTSPMTKPAFSTFISLLAIELAQNESNVNEKVHPEPDSVSQPPQNKDEGARPSRILPYDPFLEITNKAILGETP